MTVYFEQLCCYSTMQNSFNVPEKPQTLENFSKFIEESENKVRFDDATVMFSEIHLCNNAYKLQPFFEKVIVQEIKNIEKRDRSQLLNSVKNELILRLYSEKLTRLDDNDVTNMIMDDLCMSEEPGVSYEEFELFGEYFCTKHNIDLDNWGKETFNNQSPFMKVKISIMSAINEYGQCTDLFPYFVMYKLAMKDASKLKQQRAKLMQQAKEGFKVDYTKIDMPKQLILKR